MIAKKEDVLVDFPKEEKWEEFSYDDVQLANKSAPEDQLSFYALERWKKNVPEAYTQHCPFCLSAQIWR